MAKERRLNLRTGLMVDASEFELELIRLEVFINGNWIESERYLPHDQAEGLRSGRLNKITDDDSEEVAARIFKEK